MLCPCCGEPKDDRLTFCPCGAKAIGEPQTDTIAEIPKLGPAMIALTFTLGGAACYFSKFFIVLSIVGMILGFRTWQRSRNFPARYGGQKMALASGVVSLVLVGTIVTMIGFDVPKWLRGRNERQLASTRVRMLEISIALQQYKEKHSALPAQLDDLRKEGFLTGPTLDYWESRLRYVPTGQLAAVGDGIKGRPMVPAFTQYNLVSAGPDGTLGTKDDIIIDNHVFVPSVAARKPADE
ncbi:MAG: hypothetical protein K1Y36_13455 [Blastocatellia bacterium]|nr:hypothetical protein [Blastocatellia bacterium]